MTARRILPIVTVAIGLAPGCGPTAINRSPTPDQDPARYARAQREAEAVARENREAEARFYRQLRSTEPGEGGRPEPDADRPSTADDLEVADHRFNGETP